MQEETQKDKLLSTKGTFLTGVDASTGLPLSTSQDTPQSHTQQVYKIEEAVPPNFLSDQLDHLLPKNVNLMRVINNVGREKKPKKTWTANFTKDENKFIISDFFWYCICKLIRAGKHPEIEELLLDRIAYNYVQLFLSVDLNYRDKFFETYYDDLAQAVYYSLFFAFPKSRSLIMSETFMSSFFDLLCEEVTGVPVCNLAYEKWDLDLGAGNVLRNKLKRQNTNTSSLPDLQKPLAPQKKLLHMKYSPLVDRYMKGRRYEGYNVVQSWHLRYSLRNLDKQREVASRMSKYRSLASQTVKNTKQRFKKFEEYRDKVDKELIQNRKHVLKVAKLMTRRTQEILEQNPREYANLMVSLKAFWPASNED
ncbi:unnamed protein product [Blepharisma stoltei]|uniref:Uncharacterized protein n=1 Tax=Blepharisma stoltei TaxID=1481888 RepID=A0AAU9JGR9_9CILI|nr:unnamed protein product [Blepharisma stoltei]